MKAVRNLTERPGASRQLARVPSTLSGAPRSASAASAPPSLRAGAHALGNDQALTAGDCESTEISVAFEGALPPQP